MKAAQFLWHVLEFHNASFMCKRNVDDHQCGKFNVLCINFKNKLSGGIRRPQRYISCGLHFCWWSGTSQAWTAVAAGSCLGSCAPSNCWHTLQCAQGSSSQPAGMSGLWSGARQKQLQEGWNMGNRNPLNNALSKPTLYEIFHYINYLDLWYYISKSANPDFRYDYVPTLANRCISCMVANV